MTSMNLDDAAKDFIGTPFHWGARKPGIGLDCAGLIVCSANAAGFELKDWRGYGDRSAPEHIARFIEQTSEVPIEEAQPGDVMVFWIKRKDQPLHLGILTDDETVIHTHTSIKQVVEEPIGRWRDRIWGVYRLKSA